MKKQKSSRKSVKVLEIDKFDKDALIQLADSPEAESLGIYRDGGDVGFIAGDFKSWNEQLFDGPLQENEHWGEGIPYECSCDDKFGPEFCLAHGSVSDPNSQKFELRTILRDGHVELQFAKEFDDRYTDFRVGEELSDREAVEIQHTFGLRSRRFLAHCCNNLLLACYGMASDDPSKKNEAYDQIMDDFETGFKSLLKWDRCKVVEEKQDGNLRRITREPIEKGRKPTTAPEKEIEKERFKQNVFKAISELEAASQNITQINVGVVVFGGKGDPQSLIQNALRKFGLNWKVLTKEYDLQKL